MQSLDDTFSEQGRRTGFAQGNGFSMNNVQNDGLRQTNGFVEKMFFAFPAR